MSYIDYGERIKLLRLPTLLYRRARGEMIEVWKHYHVYDPKVIAPTFQLVSKGYEGNVSDRAPPSWEWCPWAQSCSFYYTAHVADTTNTLPHNTIEMSCGILNQNQNAFKNHLDNHWEDHPLRYDFLATTPNRQTCAVSDQDVEIGPQGRVTCPITFISK